MCGRYTNTVSLKKLAERFGFKTIIHDLPKRFNIAPGQDCPIVIQQEGGKELKMSHWGLVPFWVKDLAEAKNKPINARAETIDQKPSFKKSFQSKRCLVLADGFYEWRPIKGQKKKQPFRVTLENEEPFAFAGLYDQWEREGQPLLHSFTIITTGANQKLKDIHDRMPVILKPATEDVWINPEVKDWEKLKKLLKPFPDEEIHYYPVSNLVNSPKNDSKECISRIKNLPGS